MDHRDLDIQVRTHSRPDELPEVALPEAVAKPRNNYPLHIILFLATFASTTLAGVMYVHPSESLQDLFAHLYMGLPFSMLLMFFLSAHEFGHYFAARHHRVDATLPYYIPMPPFILGSIFGTMGAVIRTRTPIPNRRALFDIGIAGPLAGFVVALSYLVIGMLTMPGVESLYVVHPEYRGLASIPPYGMHFGGSLLYDGLKWLLVSPGRFFPPSNEMYHYPLLAVGWFGMFVTALNMIPVGQLDGGHIVYAMFGDRQPAISRVFVALLIVVGLGSVGMLALEATRNYSPDHLVQFLQGLFGPSLEWVSRNASWWFKGWFGWLFWVLIIRFFIKIPHPPISDETPLGRGRRILGWVSLAILVLTISYTGLYEVAGP